jgi:hypothetical protein
MSCLHFLARELRGLIIEAECPLTEITKLNLNNTKKTSKDKLKKFNIYGADSINITNNTNNNNNNDSNIQQEINSNQPNKSLYKPIAPGGPQIFSRLFFNSVHNRSPTGFTSSQIIHFREQIKIV